MEKIGKYSGVKKSRIVPILIVSIIVLFLISLGVFFAYNHITKVIKQKPSIARMKDEWQQFDYRAVYDTSSFLMEKDTFNNTVLVYRGYAAFYLAVSETESTQAQNLIDESIRCLRIALTNSKNKTLPQVEYMLGKAYFYKNSISSYYYYSDLAVKYLVNAKEDGYKADDISEYLGLSYANLGKTQESISAFSEALLVRESDSLLLSIAEQYYNSNQYSAAKQYLFQIVSHSTDDSIVNQGCILLGEIYTLEENYDDAKKEFEKVLEKNKNSSDAYYWLGVIYEKQGDIAKARSEWRKALKIQVNHPDALKKMSYYK